jgi:hypothetical protein
MGTPVKKDAVPGRGRLCQAEAQAEALGLFAVALSVLADNGVTESWRDMGCIPFEPWNALEFLLLPLLEQAFGVQHLLCVDPLFQFRVSLHVVLLWTASVVAS